VRFGEQFTRSAHVRWGKIEGGYYLGPPTFAFR